VPRRYHYTFQIVVSGHPHPRPTEVLIANTRDVIAQWVQNAIDHARFEDTGGMPVPGLPGGGAAYIWLNREDLTDVSGVTPDKIMRVGPRGGVSWEDFMEKHQ
jgi:hypothetical protein